MDGYKITEIALAVVASMAAIWFAISIETGIDRNRKKLARSSGCEIPDDAATFLRGKGYMVREASTGLWAVNGLRGISGDRLIDFAKQISRNTD